MATHFPMWPAAASCLLVEVVVGWNGDDGLEVGFPFYALAGLLHPPGSLPSLCCLSPFQFSLGPLASPLHLGLESGLTEVLGRHRLNS